MTTTDQYDRRNFKAFQYSDDEELQLSWIDGLIEQVEFANKPDVRYHNCPKKQLPAAELRSFRKRGMFED